MRIFQTLTLMDRQDAHTVCSVALDGLTADGLLPLTDECINI